MAESSYYPPLSIASHTGRFTLNYPRSLRDVEAYHQTITKDKTATKYLQAYHNGKTTFQEALDQSREQALDRSRMHFDLHLPDPASRYIWAGACALIRMEGEGISSLDPDQKKEEQDEVEIERTGEIGVLLSSASHRKSIFSEAIIVILDLAFNSPTSISNPISSNSSKNGFDLSKIFIVTHHQNEAMRGFSEKVLDMEKLEFSSPDLTDSLRKMMQEELESEDRSVVYCLKRETWFGGKREKLIADVERKFGKPVQVN